MRCISATSHSAARFTSSAYCGMVLTLGMRRTSFNCSRNRTAFSLAYSCAFVIIIFLLGALVESHTSTTLLLPPLSPCTGKGGWGNTGSFPEHLRRALPDRRLVFLIRLERPVITHTI